jgi:hypothetical protein
MLGENIQSLLVVLIGIESPTYASHVGVLSPTSASHVGVLSPTSDSHVGDMQPTYVSHVGGNSSATTSHVGGIDIVEKTRHIGSKPEFFCKLCKGDHLTHFFLAIIVEQ